MDETTDRIRQEIARTRADIAETIAAIGSKADVSSTIRNTVERRSTELEKALRNAFSFGRAPETSSRPTGAMTMPRLSLNTDIRSPLAAALAALAAGVLVGAVLPLTKFERRRFGGLGERFGAGAREFATRAMNEGRAAAEETVNAASAAVSMHVAHLASEEPQKVHA